MYEAYWGLQSKPFENTMDTRFYYPSESHQAALLKLRYAIENRRGGAVLTGGPGLGKSLLVQSLFGLLPDTIGPRIHLVFPQMPPDQLLHYLANELTGERHVREVPSIEGTVRRIQTSLADNSAAGRHAVVAVDESQLIDHLTTLDTLRLLLNFETDGVGGLTLLFVGHPSFLPIVDRHPGLEERLAVKCLLRPFDLDETASYISHRLREAGADRVVFDDSATEAIHRVARGIPRQINRLCDLALLIGFAEDRLQIDADAIDAVAMELVSVAPE